MLGDVSQQGGVAVFPPGSDCIPDPALHRLQPPDPLPGKLVAAIGRALVIDPSTQLVAIRRAVARGYSGMAVLGDVSQQARWSGGDTAPRDDLAVRFSVQRSRLYGFVWQ